MQGTHEKEFLGIPSTGKKIEYSAAEIYDFEDGKVKSLKNFQRTNDPGWIQYLRE
jgi:predicted ester cyclase